MGLTEFHDGTYSMNASNLLIILFVVFCFLLRVCLKDCTRLCIQIYPTDLRVHDFRNRSERKKKIIYKILDYYKLMCLYKYYNFENFVESWQRWHIGNILCFYRTFDYFYSYEHTLIAFTQYNDFSSEMKMYLYFTSFQNALKI